MITEIISKIKTELATFTDDAVDYVMSRNELTEQLEIKNKQDALDTLENFDFVGGEFENTARESGYMRGMKDALNIIESTLNNKLAEGNN